MISGTKRFTLKHPRILLNTFPLFYVLWAIIITALFIYHLLCKNGLCLRGVLW